MFSKMMKQQVQIGVQLILDRLSSCIQQYEQILGQYLENKNAIDINMRSRIRSFEKQIAYVMRVANSFFSFGLPSSSSKLQVRYAAESQMTKIKNRYDDISIFGRIIYLIKMINQLKQHDNNMPIFVDLEVEIMKFISMFKSSILGDPRLLLIA